MWTSEVSPFLAFPWVPPREGRKTGLLREGKKERGSNLICTIQGYFLVTIGVLAAQGYFL